VYSNKVAQLFSIRNGVSGAQLDSPGPACLAPAPRPSPGPEPSPAQGLAQAQDRLIGRSNRQLFSISNGVSGVQHSSPGPECQAPAPAPRPWPRAGPGPKPRPGLQSARASSLLTTWKPLHHYTQGTVCKNGPEPWPTP